MKTIFLLLLVLVFLSCHRSKQLKEAPAVNALFVKDAFTVILPEDHRNGYTWVLDPNFDENICSHINTVWHGNDKGVYFEFKALKPGESSLKFLSRKYTDTLDIKTFSLKIRAQ